MTDISNMDDIIDSRDVIARIEELEGERDDLEGEALAIWTEENGEELKSLTELASEAEGYADDWHHGETLIRDSYFQEYAQERADDLGLIKSDVSWPYDCIDWEQAARQLQMDYTAVDFGGVTYWVR